MNNESHLLKEWIRQKNINGFSCLNNELGMGSHGPNWAMYPGLSTDEVLIIKCMDCGFLMSFIKQIVLANAEQICPDV